MHFPVSLSNETATHHCDTASQRALHARGAPSASQSVAAAQLLAVQSAAVSAHRSPGAFQSPAEKKLCAHPLGNAATQPDVPQSGHVAPCMWSVPNQFPGRRGPHARVGAGYAP